MAKLPDYDLTAPTDSEVVQYLNGTEPTNVAKKTRYKQHRGEARLISKQYGKDLASVLKMRFVQGHTLDEISQLTGLSLHMVTEMIAPFKVIMDDPERIRAFKAHEPVMLDGVRMLMLQGMVDQLTDEKRRKKMDLSRLTVGYGILFDKARLERGESTSNVMTLSDLVRAAHAKEVAEAPIEEAEVSSGS